MHYVFKKRIHEALHLGKIEGRLSVTIFTLEGISKPGQKNLLGGYKPKIAFTEEGLPNGSIHIGCSIGPDQTARPGNNGYLILIRSRNSVNYIPPSGARFHPLMVCLKGAETVHQLLLRRLQAVEGAVVEILFPQLIPEMLLRVEFG